MKIIECPRDALQGLVKFVPTELKIKYINQLLKVGFDTIDVGSFVSPSVIPQMRDTKEVLANINLATSSSKLLVIVANLRGAQEASVQESVSYLGFPLSISETFQQRNTNATIKQAMELLHQIQTICKRANKELVTYISMGFGNPYGDAFTLDIVQDFVGSLEKMEVKIISLADTIGVATSDQIHFLFTELTKTYPSIEFGAHLHSSPIKAASKISVAYEAGCKRFDGAIKGFGGCPMAKDELVGNMATETIIDFLTSKKIELNLNLDELDKALRLADEVFYDH